MSGIGRMIWLDVVMFGRLLVEGVGLILGWVLVSSIRSIVWFCWIEFCCSVVSGGSVSVVSGVSLKLMMVMFLGIWWFVWCSACSVLSVVRLFVVNSLLRFGICFSSWVVVVLLFFVVKLSRSIWVVW